MREREEQRGAEEGEGGAEQEDVEADESKQRLLWPIGPRKSCHANIRGLEGGLELPLYTIYYN